MRVSATTDFPRSVKVRPIWRTGHSSMFRNMMKANNVPTVSVPFEMKYAPVKSTMPCWASTIRSEVDQYQLITRSKRRLRSR